MSIRTLVSVVNSSSLILTGGARLTFARQDSSQSPRGTIDSDGTVRIPAQLDTLSSFVSPEAKAHPMEHLRDMPNTELVNQDQGMPRFMKRYLEHDEAHYSVAPPRPSCGRRTCEHNL